MRQADHFLIEGDQEEIGFLQGEQHLLTGLFAGSRRYYRWRERGKRKVHTEYYGQADVVLANLADLPLAMRR